MTASENDVQKYYCQAAIDERLATAQSKVAHYVAQVGALSRSRKADDPDLVQARRDLYFAKLEEHAERVVSTWGPLSPAERDRLHVLLDLS